MTKPMLLPLDITLIDNHDSFTHNLVHLLRQALESQGQRVLVRDRYRPWRALEGDESSIEVIRPDETDGPCRLQPRPDRACALVVSPGPCSPLEAPYALEAMSFHHGRVPLLGVCLGHQVLAHMAGAEVVRAKQPRHGKTSVLVHTQQGLFRQLPQGFEVMRYHSLAIAEDSLPPQWQVVARAADDLSIMAIEHLEAPSYGLQFHPESIATAYGLELMLAFLKEAMKNQALKNRL